MDSRVPFLLHISNYEFTGTLNMRDEEAAQFNPQNVCCYLCLLSLVAKACTTFGLFLVINIWVDFSCTNSCYNCCVAVLLLLTMMMSLCSNFFSYTPCIYWNLKNCHSHHFHFVYRVRNEMSCAPIFSEIAPFLQSKSTHSKSTNHPLSLIKNDELFLFLWTQCLHVQDNAGIWCYIHTCRHTNS